MTTCDCLTKTLLKNTQVFLKSLTFLEVGILFHLKIRKCSIESERSEENYLLPLNHETFPPETSDKCITRLLSWRTSTSHITQEPRPTSLRQRYKLWSKDSSRHC